MKEYIFYVNKFNIFKNDYDVYAYRCKTKDALHTMGEMLYRTMEHIRRIDFVECTKEREDYIHSRGMEIYEWKDKYPYADEKRLED